MRQLDKFQRLLVLVFSVQMLILLMTDVILRKMLTVISQRLHELMYAGIPAIEQKAGDYRTVLAILTGAHWLILLAMLLTLASFGVLFLIAKSVGAKNNHTGLPMPPLVRRFRRSGNPLKQ